MAKELPKNLKIRLPEFCTGCQIGQYEIDTLHVELMPYYTLYCTHQRACDAMRKKTAKNTAPIVNQ